MIGKNKLAWLPCLATPLVALALLAFGGCSGGGFANMAPVEGEPPDSPEIEAIKKSGKPPREIVRLIRAEVNAKATAAAKKPQGKKRPKP